MMHYNGKGTTQNYLKAVEWFQKAAAKGNRDACSILGFCYYMGQGVYQDNKEAYYWTLRGGPSKNEALASIKNLLEYEIPALERIEISRRALKDGIEAFREEYKDSFLD